ncbi:DUF4145 domain-containing protein [Candidatus Contubernalis alkaliaceticus]|uniref:DUF4145 domain-containing protein n=1 Tax=Candidatus Contubernalis alkaliaceticus TaxID=338645 RepID=UPI001F4C14B1|nr:DUF4145 domain-containing protein [Candidatus Contubernalis alkalaceticus]UNC91645.1 DUF4145 domain-containing protein [Candidatus Contubernalis alkalaceticus]
MIIKLDGNVERHNNEESLNMRCPSCRQLGSFKSLLSECIRKHTGQQLIFLGHRVCPNEDCLAHVFIVWDSDRNIMISYPPELLDFDSSNIPPNIINIFEEALICHANKTFIASAIMVRRTLEELCNDKSAQGENLKEKIIALGNKVIIPSELLEGLDNLRLLGNDAAHVEAQIYQNIGKEEVELAIDVTKEVLKAVYQYASLVKRLNDLKK